MAYRKSFKKRGYHSGKRYGKSFKRRGGKTLRRAKISRGGRRL